ncbi:MAG: D-amino acid aminotransferase [Sulfuricellaceae bacterium]
MTVYLNGLYLPLEEACIPVLDRGFIFGDGVYELIPVYSRRPFRLGDHLARLQYSLDGIRLANPHSEAEWEQRIFDLIARNSDEDMSLYLHITRGVAPRDHAFPQGVAPTVFMMLTPLNPPPLESVERGIAVVSATDNRWLRCDIKAISLLPNVLLRQLAVDAEAVETVLLREGFLSEGTASTIFVVRNDKLLAPPKGHLMLPGITYDIVLELANANGIACEIREISEFEVRSAQELWMASSSKEVLAITTLDGQPVRNGKPGAVFRKMYQLYQEYKTNVMRNRNSAEKQS